MYWFNFKKWFGTKKKLTSFNFNLNQMYKLQLMHPKQIKNKLHMKAINYACLKLEEKATKNVKKNKIYFANVIGDNFVIIACIGVSTPSLSKTIPPSFSLSPPLNLQTVQVPPLLAIPPYILFFLGAPP